MFAKVFLI